MIARLTLIAAAVLTSAPATHAAILSVPADHGTIQAAVDAAVDLDVIVVTPADYAEDVVVDGKAITLLAENGVAEIRSLFVHDLAPAQTFVLRGFDVGPANIFVNPGLASLTLEDNQGLVRIEDCSFSGTLGAHFDAQLPIPGGPGARVTSCDAVVFTGCTLVGGTSGTMGTTSIFEPADGGAGLAVDGGQVEASDCSITGGVGGASADNTSANGGHGGPGLDNDGGFVSVTGGTLTGGQGGDGDCCTSAPVGNGGDALRQSGAAAIAWTRDAALVPGLKGATCGNGSESDGQMLNIAAGVHLPLSAPHKRLTTNSPVREGDTLTLSFVGEAGDAILLWIGVTGLHLPLLARQGVFTTGLPFLAGGLPLGALPGGGTLDVPLVIGDFGPGFSNLDLHVQAAYGGTGGTLLGAGSVTTLLDGLGYDKLLEDPPTTLSHFGIGADVSGDRVIVGVPGQPGGSAPGTAYVFVADGEGWELQAELVRNDGGNPSPARFGAAVAIDGDLAVVGATGDWPLESGAAYVFFWDGTDWVQERRIAGNPGLLDEVGASVAVHGDTVVVGAPEYGIPRDGAAFVYARNVVDVFGQIFIQWNLEATLFGPGTPQDFGTSVAIHGDTVVVGDPRADAQGAVDAGRAFVYERTGSTWGPPAELVIADSATHREFGTGVSTDGTRVAVGAPNDLTTGGGAVYVFSRSGSLWVEDQKFAPADLGGNDDFGWSVDLEDDRMAVGAVLGDAGTEVNTGAVYVLTRSGSTWSQERKLVTRDATDGDFLGQAVGLDADLVVSGAARDDDFGADSGSVYVFDLTAP